MRLEKIFRKLAATTLREPRIRRSAKMLAALAIGASACGAAAWSQDEDANEGGRDMVYTESNAAGGNEILAFASDNGSLVLASRASTHGLGTEGGLGNQGALAFDARRHFLFAVNAGSDEISVLKAVRDGGLTFVDKIPSGGTRPVSLALRGDVLYVLNAGGSGNISGFSILWDGHLRPIAGSTRPLSSPQAGAAEISFDREGEVLAVTEKATNKIDVYTVEDDIPSNPGVINSVGKTPFGFAFDRHNHLLVSEAFGGAPDAGAVSSYDLDEDIPSLEVISPSVPTHQSAPCWVVLGAHGRFAYATNTGSGSVSGYRVSRDGSLTLLNPDGITATTGAGSGPTDAAVSRRGRFLFVLAPQVGLLEAFIIRRDGSLLSAGSAAGVPTSATGLESR